MDDRSDEDQPLVKSFAVRNAVDEQYDLEDMDRDEDSPLRRVSAGDRGCTGSQVVAVLVLVGVVGVVAAWPYAASQWAYGTRYGGYGGMGRPGAHPGAVTSQANVLQLGDARVVAVENRSTGEVHITVRCKCKKNTSAPCTKERIENPTVSVPASRAVGRGVTRDDVWDALKHFDYSVFSRPGVSFDQAVQKFQDFLVPFIEAPPMHEAKVTKRPWSLADELKCDDPRFKDSLSGSKRAKPARVIDFIPFASELDILEMRLYDLDEAVDVFVILESTHNHRGRQKPLFFERNKERFARFLPKILHIITDDAYTLRVFKSRGNPTMSDAWKVEHEMRKLIYERFVEAYGQPRPDDLLMHGDCDELPSSKVVYHLKHCTLRNPHVNYVSNAIMYTYSFKWAFSVDNWARPRGDLLWSRGTPYLAQVSSALDTTGGFKRKGSGVVLPLGGAHITWHGWLPYTIYKSLSIVESWEGGLRQLIQELPKDPRALQEKLFNHEMVGGGFPAHRFRLVTKLPPEYPQPVWMPWFVAENRERFPYLVPPGTPTKYSHL